MSVFLLYFSPGLLPSEAYFLFTTAHPYVKIGTSSQEPLCHIYSSVETPDFLLYPVATGVTKANTTTVIPQSTT